VDKPPGEPAGERAHRDKFPPRWQAAGLILRRCRKRRGPLRSPITGCSKVRGFQMGIPSALALSVMRPTLSKP
jgi:hypothetical protein